MKDISKEGVSINLNLGEKSTFEKMEEMFKSTIFSVFFVLLKKQDFSFLLEILKVSIQLMQLLSFSFNPLVNISSNKISS